jgi:putative NADH-flavin reductase
MSQPRRPAQTGASLLRLLAGRRDNSPGSPAPPRVAVLGATGDVGRRIVDRALARGFAVTAQTRDPEKLSDVFDRVRVMKFMPWSESRMPEFVRGQDVVVFALGLDHGGATTLFSQTTRALVQAMQAQGVRRLIAITGVGAGETRGHGGVFYDWLIYPLFTRQRYVDKNAQEALIFDSGLDWTIVRPARFVQFGADGPLQRVTKVERETVLRKVTRDEVAGFVIGEIETPAHLRQSVFLGHA